MDVSLLTLICFYLHTYIIRLPFSRVSKPSYLSPPTRSLLAGLVSYRGARISVAPKIARRKAKIVDANHPQPLNTLVLVCLGRRALPLGLCWSWSAWESSLCLHGKEGSAPRSVLVLVWALPFCLCTLLFHIPPCFLELLVS